jgi:hypothetical protein
MIAIREIREVKAGVVTVAIPPHFHAKKVEIIILPLEDDGEEPQNLQDLLLRAPILTADELQEYARVREWMNEWPMNDFAHIKL